MSGQFPPPPGAPPGPEDPGPATGQPGWGAPPPPDHPGPSYQLAPRYGPPPPGYGPPESSGTPPGYQQPAWAPPVQAPPPGWRPPPGMLGAAHKPGAIALRPLGLGDILDGAFRIIRFNPRATVGSAVLVAGAAAVLSVAATFLLTLWFTSIPNLSGFTDDTGSYDDSAYVVAAVIRIVPSILSAIGTILVTGMIAHVTAAAAVGRRLGLGDAWRATRGKRWRLIGLAALLGLLLVLLVSLYVVLFVVVVVVSDSLAALVLYAVFGSLVFLMALFWFWIRVYYLPVPVLMLEDVGVFGAIDRGFRLTRQQFWRIFGIAVLTWLITAVASFVIGIPVGLISAAVTLGTSSDTAILVSAVASAVGSVLGAAFITPFTSSVTSLQYLDQRMRKEAYDVELMQQAGVIAA